MKIEVNPTWRQWVHVVRLTVNNHQLTYEGSKETCEQIAKDLRTRINRSGKKNRLTTGAKSGNL